MSVPYGDVVLDDAGRPAVFASAGIGIAPMAGMLSHLVTANSGLSITLLHADSDEGAFPLRRQVVSDVLALRNAALHVWYEREARSNEPVTSVHEGLMDLAAVELPRDATYYMCGPVPFMQALRSALIERDVAPKDIQYEVFGPDLWQADFDCAPVGAGSDLGEIRPRR
jgi:nitric oxide dioxygenase